MGKPSEADARILGSLFPSASQTKRKFSKAFSPLDDCVVSKQKQQKKATRVKAWKVTVIMIPEQSYMKVGYIKQLEFSRNMSSQEVQNIIIRGFSDKIVGKPDIVFYLLIRSSMF